MGRRTARRWRGLALLLAAIAGLAGTSGAMATEPRMVWATEGTYPPWNSIGPDGELTGFDIELVELLCARMTVGCTIVAAEWPAMIDELVDGAYAAIISGIAITPERAERMLFSLPYLGLSLSFASGSGSPFAGAAPATPEEAIGLVRVAVIGVQGGTVNEEFARAMIPDARVVTFTTQTDLNAAVAIGRVDAGLAATEAWAGHGGIAVMGPPVTSNDYALLGAGLGVGLSPRSFDIKARMDAAICGLSRDGTLAELSIRWFDRDLSVPCVLP